jgi:hypothetical protein
MRTEPPTQAKHEFGIPQPSLNTSLRCWPKRAPKNRPNQTTVRPARRRKKGGLRSLPER